MALSGTLSTFGLPDVLRLLAGTGKSGSLHVHGPRVGGRLDLVDGALAGATSDRTSDAATDAALEHVVFDLLRVDDGDFEFRESEQGSIDASAARDVDDVLEAAQELLGEWAQIEAVVPSLDVHVRLVTDRDRPVTLSPTEWRLVVAIAAGGAGRDLAARLGLGEFAACAQLRDLVEAGIIDVDASPTQERTGTDEPGADEDDATTASATEDEAGGAPDATEDVATDDVRPAGPQTAARALVEELAWVVRPAVDLDRSEDADVEAVDEDWWTTPADRADSETDDVALPAIDGFEAAVETAVDATVAATSVVDEIEAQLDDDVLSQLANLSPKAAAAVSATAIRPATDEHPSGPVDAPDERDEDGGRATTVDESRLLRFLNSAQS